MFKYGNTIYKLDACFYYLRGGAPQGPQAIDVSHKLHVFAFFLVSDEQGKRCPIHHRLLEVVTTVHMHCSVIDEQPIHTWSLGN